MELEFWNFANNSCWWRASSLLDPSTFTTPKEFFQFIKKFSFVFVTQIMFVMRAKDDDDHQTPSSQPWKVRLLT